LFWTASIVAGYVQRSQDWHVSVKRYKNSKSVWPLRKKWSLKHKTLCRVRKECLPNYFACGPLLASKNKQEFSILCSRKYSVCRW